tara:strand:+ start:241 stop:672 length:432 start_codon:yes stop_codon:yes gene_type:complete
MNNNKSLNIFNFKILKKHLVIILFSIFCILLVYSIFNKDKLLNTQKNKEKFTVNNLDNTFTMYYADWCGHCQRAKPHFTKFMERINSENGKFKCRMISDKDTQDSDIEIDGYPMFVLRKNGEKIDFDDSRDENGFERFIKKYL